MACLEVMPDERSHKGWRFRGLGHYVKLLRLCKRQGNLGLCPQGSIDDFKASVGAGPIRIQLIEKKLAKIFGVFQSEVVEKK